MSETPIIGFRLVGVNTTEAGKAASANENALIAEALFKQRVESRSTSAPPGSPSNGDVYIVPDASASPAPSGAWAGHEDEIAIYYNGWLFVAPINGPVFYVADEDLSVKYDDTASPPAWVVGGASTFIGQSDTPASYSGQAGKAAVVNSDETGLEFGASAALSGVRVERVSTVQAVANLTETAIIWNSVPGTNGGVWDEGDFHDPAGANPTRVIIPTGSPAAVYAVTAGWVLEAVSSGQTFLGWVQKNGEAQPGQAHNSMHANTSASARKSLIFATEIELVGDDYLELICFHNHGSSLDIQAVPATFMTVRKIAEL